MVDYSKKNVIQNKHYVTFANLRPAVDAKRLAELAAMPDNKIDTSDIPETGEAFFAKTEKFMTGMVKLKRAMLGKGLRRAWTKCPICSERVDATLNGSKNHMHASCRGCKTAMME